MSSGQVWNLAFMQKLPNLPFIPQTNSALKLADNGHRISSPNLWFNLSINFKILSSLNQLLTLNSFEPNQTYFAPWNLEQPNIWFDGIELTTSSNAIPHSRIKNQLIEYPDHKLRLIDDSELNH